MNTDREKTIDAVVAGYLCVDLAPGFGKRKHPIPLQQLIKPGKLIEVEGLNISLGGAVANTGLLLNHYDIKTHLMGLVGEDWMGEYILSRIHDLGIESSIKKSKINTAYGLVIAPPGVDRIFFESPGCSRVFKPGDLDYNTIQNSRLFHFGYPPLLDQFFLDNGKQLTELFARVKDQDVITSLDMSLPDENSPSGQVDWQSILQNTLPHVDIFTPSIEEIVFMLEPDIYRELAANTDQDLFDIISDELVDKLSNQIIQSGVNVLFLKAGSRGAYLKVNPNAQLAFSMDENTLKDIVKNGCWIPANKIDQDRFLNASGAGDTAIAGFLAALLRGTTIQQAGKIAMRAAEHNLYTDESVNLQVPWQALTD